MLETLSKIWRFSAKEKSNLNKSLIISVIHAFFYVLQMGAVYFILLSVVNNGEKLRTSLMSFAIILASIFGRMITNYYAQLRQTHAGYFMVANARIKMTDKLKKIPMGLLNNSKMENISGILTTGLSETENTVPSILITMLTGFLTAFVFTIMVFIFDIRIGIVVAIATLIYLYVSDRMQKVSAKVAPKRANAQINLSDRVLEHIQAMPVIKSFNLTGKGDKNTRDAIFESKKTNLEVERRFTPFTIFSSLILNVASFILMYLAIRFYFDQTMNLTNSLMTLIMSYIIFSQIQEAGSSMSELRIVASSIDKVDDIMSLSEMKSKSGLKLTSKRNIEFNNVSFSYGNEKIIDKVSFKIPEKTTVAFIGPSGAGKTTLSKLIARFWDVDSGDITIGGVNIKDISLEELMDNISIVFQSVYLFNDTIENNIKFGNPNASHEEVINAAKKAACHDFIMALPKGYDTVIGEGGANLSGGEKQRISIARAIIKDAPIIILDEATANVDPENEDKLQITINSLMKEKTVIMIAHKLNTIKNADQIIVLEKGQIVQKGEHDELIKEEGIYSDFIKIREKAENWKIK